MQRALRPFATAGVVVMVGASLVAITPVVAPNIEQRAVVLAAVEDIIDLGTPIEAVGLADALPSLGDLSAAFGDGLPDLGSALSAAADLPALDAITDFWQEIQGWVVTGLAALFGLLFWGVLVPGAGFLQLTWQAIADFFGFDPYPYAAVAFDSGVPDVFGAGAVDAVLSAGVDSTVGDMSAVFGGAEGLLDLTTVVQDLTAAFDPAEFGDVGELVSASLTPDIGDILSSLIP
ncbi:hypothetical protein MSP7336_04433 [Mycobacterium shimoidei]|uniref:Uncharacterized protein n=1 Tax=Mycobacterium shimoidei TaxID=29313 RepID=A0A375Z4Z6_MYCSH|nr:hypothetical protein [Mycobacterium shimoidei]SRX96157.1 hypothetical protein MSP7336_04433 [Mycobacterium shimoidei]